VQELTMRMETANIKLTQLDKLKSEFLSFASHQIKAPMTVVKGYATLILDGSYGAVSDGVREVADKIRQSADRMIGLVNTFLDLRRLDEGRITYQFEELDIGTLVASVVDEMQQLAVRKKLTLRLEPLPRQWKVSADPQHLRQVLQNLVDNAVKYTDHGSVTVTLSEGDRDAVRIAVADSGRGISPDLLGRLFQQFSRDQSIAKEIAGTGLGLYIAKQMVEAHKGKLWAESPGPGKGSTFIVELPHL
jgi:signal transduction histidine kinase